MQKKREEMNLDNTIEFQINRRRTIVRNNFNFIFNMRTYVPRRGRAGLTISNCGGGLPLELHGKKRKLE